MACASGADATTRHAVSGQLACLRAANGCQLWVLTATTFVATFKGPIGPRTHSMAKDLYELVINATSSLSDKCTLEQLQFFETLFFIRLKKVPTEHWPKFFFWGISVEKDLMYRCTI